MTTAVVAMIVAGVAIVIGVVITQGVLDGQTTTTWSAGTVSLTFLLPLVLAAGGIIGILKLVGRG